MTLEHRIGRLLTVATLVGVVALAVGVVAMLAAGISPLDQGAAAFDPAALPGQVRALDPVGLLWLGLVIVIATPPMRVAAALVGYVVRREWRMALVASGILAVISVGIGLGLAGG